MDFIMINKQLTQRSRVHM